MGVGDQPPDTGVSEITDDSRDFDEDPITESGGELSVREAEGPCYPFVQGGAHAVRVRNDSLTEEERRRRRVIGKSEQKHTNSFGNWGRYARISRTDSGASALSPIDRSVQVGNLFRASSDVNRRPTSVSSPVR